MKKLVKKTAVTALAGVMAAGMLSGCGEQKMDGAKTVATVDGTEIPLGVVSLLARQEQAYMEAMYASYMGGYSFEIWDKEADTESGQTYGEQTVEECLNQIELMYILKAKAADYGVEITEEDKTAIAEAAASFMAANSEETIETLGVTEEQVKTLLELQTYQERMYDPVVADVDREVSDEEAQQSAFTYVSVLIDDGSDEEGTEEVIEETEEVSEETEETEEDAEAADAEDVAETEEDAEAADAEADADTEEAAEDGTEAADAQKEKLQKVLDAMKDDPEADMDEAAKDVDETMSALSGTFTTHENEDDTSAYPDEVLEVLRGLKEGEVCDEIIETDTYYYIVRLDEEFDEEATETKKESIISDRESDLYTETTEQWMDDAEIKVEEKVLKTLRLTDSHKFSLITPEAEEEEIVEEDETDVDEEIVDESEDSPEIKTEEEIDAEAEAGEAEEAEELTAAEEPEEDAEK